MSSKPRPRKADLPAQLDVLLSLDEVAAAVEMSVGELRRARARGEFPAPDSPDGEKPKYRTSTVQAHIQARYSRGTRL